MSQSIKTTSLYKSYASYSSEEPMSMKNGYLHKNNKKNHFTAYGTTTLGAVAGIGLLFFLFSKGGPRKVSAFFKRQSQHLNEKMSGMLSTNKNAVNRITYHVMKKLSNVFSYFQGITNIASLKDIACKKILPKRFHEITSSMFKKSAVRTVNNSYTVALSDMEKFLQTVVSKADPNNKAEIERLVNNIRDNLNNSFEHFARTDRRNFIENEFVNLDKEVINTISNATKNRQWRSYVSFIAEDLAQPAKDAVNIEINFARKLITNNIAAISKDLNVYTEKIKGRLIPADTNGYQSINRVEDLIKTYSKLSGSSENAERKQISEKIINEIDEIIAKVATSSRYDKEKQNIIDDAQMIREILIHNKKGDIEEILTILRNSTDEKTYKKMIYPASQRAIKSLIKANEDEGIKLVDKIRDIEVGSACCDSATILGGVAFTGAYMANTRSQEEFVSTGLQGGIPAIATLSSVFYATSRLLSGGAAIIFGFAMGTLFNTIGTKIDGIAQKYMAKQKEMKKVYSMYQANNKSFTN